MNAAPRFLPLVLPLFLGSGAAALIYEVVWLQMLQLVIGSSAISLAVLLGTFMGGMCLGSLLLPRFVSASRHPLRVYALLEIGIAISSLLVLVALPFVGHVYIALVGHGLPGVVLRALVCLVCLLPPTVMMGATLPTIARWVEATPRGISWLGFFYGGNTAGAVAGCLLAGFYLLRLHDTTTATLAAASLNFAVAGLALLLARLAPFHPASVPAATATAAARPPPHRGDQMPTVGRGPDWIVLAAIGLSGLCALAAEVVWTRVLSLLLGATVYTFAIILAVFLAGLGLGSSLGATLARDQPRPRPWFAVCQLLLVGAIAWAAHMTGGSLPQWPLDTSLPAAPAVKFQVDLVRCAWAILPASFLWGASFPLALACLARPGADPARLVGRAYAANTLGAILGAVGASLVLIPVLGSQRTQQALVVLSALGGILILWPRHPREFALAGAVVAGALAVALGVPRLPWQLVAYGRHVAVSDYGASPLFLGEGMNSSVAVSEGTDGARFFHVSGKTEASSLAQDMRLQRLLGHLPALLHPQPRSVLIVGCGAGVTAGTFVLHPTIQRIVICDIEPLIPQVVATHFRLENHDVLRDPRVEIVHDDARHYLATTREQFDLITSDPIHPWVKGSAVLYSQEYFALCRARLRPGGLMSQWVPLYESDRAVVQSELATFLSVFPHGTIWSNDDDGHGYDTVLLGQTEALAIDLEALELRLERPDHVRVRAALAEIGLGSAIGLLSTYAGRRAELHGWLAPAEINRDRNLRLQYLAGLQLDSHSGTAALHEILERRRFPEDLFRAPPERRRELERALNHPR